VVVGEPKDISRSWLCENMILTYKLEYRQLEILKRIIKSKAVSGQGIRSYDAENFEDILSVSYFMAFLNFSHLKAEEKSMFLRHVSCWVKEIKAASKGKAFSLNIPLTYLLNTEDEDFKKLSYLYIEEGIFENEEKLRLMLLQKIKDMEGRGRKEGAGEMPTRLVRVLLMYRQLLKHGWIDKDRCDKICKAALYDPVSTRSFQRDIGLIRKIENIRFDAESRRYVLEREDDI
jgi:hypothetical protein